MVGAAPVFYRIPVTQALADALVTASYPEQTVVSKFVPPVPDPNRYADRGMRPLDNRRFEAFKAGIVRLFLYLNQQHSRIIAELSHVRSVIFAGEITMPQYTEREVCLI